MVKDLVAPACLVKGKGEKYHLHRMDMFRNLGAALRLVREQRGLAQVALARQAGIGKSQLSKYESGKERPKLDSLERLLDVLKIGPADFFVLADALDRELDRMSSTEPRPAGEVVVLHSGILNEPLQEAFAHVQRQLLELHGAMIAETLRLSLTPDRGASGSKRLSR